MKIKIEEEYLNLDEDFTIVVDEYSKDSMNENVNSEFIQSSEYYNSDNDYFEQKRNDGFKVEIQYLDEDVSGSDNELSNNYNSSEDVTNYKEDNYKGVINDKYKDYDKFCHNQEINYNYDNDITYDEPVNSKFENDENIQANQYNVCNSEKEIGFMDECDYEEGTNNRDIFEFTKELGEIKTNRKNNDGNIYEENCETSDSCSNNEYEEYNTASHNYYKNNYESDYVENYTNTCKVISGEIKVAVKLGDKNGIEIKGAKINLYELNGVCPKLYESGLTDCNGEITFKNLDDGCYRIISIVDRRFFEKPQYISWNEVTIDSFVKCANVCVVNRLKPSCLKR